LDNMTDAVESPFLAHEIRVVAGKFGGNIHSCKNAGAFHGISGSKDGAVGGVSGSSTGNNIEMACLQRERGFVVSVEAGKAAVFQQSVDFKGTRMAGGEVAEFCFRRALECQEVAA
jgi:hypothetical protein